MTKHQPTQQKDNNTDVNGHINKQKRIKKENQTTDRRTSTFRWKSCHNLPDIAL